MPKELNDSGASVAKAAKLRAEIDRLVQEGQLSIGDKTLKSGEDVATDKKESPREFVQRRMHERDQ